MSFQFYTTNIYIAFLIMYYTTIFMFCILKKKVKYINFKKIKKLNKKKNNIILNLYKKIILNQEINLINYKINQEINNINKKLITTS